MATIRPSGDSYFFLLVAMKSLADLFGDPGKRFLFILFLHVSASEGLAIYTKA